MATFKEKNMNLLFQIKSIDILDFELKHPQIQIPTQTLFHYNINIQHNINADEKLIFVTVSVNIFHKDQKTMLGSIKVSNIFIIENFDEVMEKNNKIISLPKETIDIINSISVSTTRGVMFACFRGTFLHNSILPVVDPKIFKQEEIKNSE